MRMIRCILNFIRQFPTSFLLIILLLLLQPTPTNSNDLDNIEEINLGGVIVTLSYNGNIMVPHPEKKQPHWAQRTAIETLHMTCHLALQETLDPEKIPSQCCQAMRLAAKKASKTKRTKDSFMQLFRKAILETEEQNCLHRGSLIPDMTRLIPKDRTPTSDLDDTEEYPQTGPIYSYTNYGMPLRSGTLGPALGTYAWSSKNDDGMWLNDYTVGSIPFVESLLLSKDAHFNANVEVTFGQDGGMHRQLQQKLGLPLPKSHRTKDCHLKATWMIWLPNGVFVDAEDAFDRDSIQIAMGDVNLLVPPNKHPNLRLQTSKVIDIEQPAFDSPEHAALIHLDWNGDLSATESLETKQLSLQVATKIHLRYPSPSNETYVPLVVMPPLMIQGTLTTNDNNGKIVTRTFVQGNEHPLSNFLIRPPATKGKQKQKALAALSTWVAAGTEEDFVAVVTSTVCFSILGSLLLLFQVHRMRKEKME